MTNGRRVVGKASYADVTYIEANDGEELNISFKSDEGGDEEEAGESGCGAVHDTTMVSFYTFLRFFSFFNLNLFNFFFFF